MWPALHQAQFLLTNGIAPTTISRHVVIRQKLSFPENASTQQEGDEDAEETTFNGRQQPDGLNGFFAPYGFGTVPDFSTEAPPVLRPRLADGDASMADASGVASSPEKSERKKKKKDKTEKKEKKRKSEAGLATDTSQA